MWPGLAAEDTFFDLLASDWVQIVHNGSKLWYWDSLFCASRLHFEWAWEFLGGHLVSLWGAWGVRMDAAGD